MEIPISDQKAADYLREAHRAINDVFLLLYPEWRLRKVCYGLFTRLLALPDRGQVTCLSSTFARETPRTSLPSNR